jgi:hypothetical protein
MSVTMPVPRFVRENVFLVAAVALPALVVAFFLAATALPRWLVAPPAYDLLIRVNDSYDQGRPRVALDFNVRNGQLEVSARAVATDGYPRLATLWLFEHKTMNLRQIPLDVPTNLKPDDPPRVIPVPQLAGRHVLPEVKAPDGYELRQPGYSSPGLVGDLFGMHGSNRSLTLVNRGRVVPIPLPPPREYYVDATTIGWLANEGGR